QIFEWAPGTSHTIATNSPQGAGGTRNVFASWSDAGAISHSVVAPPFAATFTANFTTQYLLTTDVSPGGSGSITASPSSSDGFYDSGASVQLTAMSIAGFTFAGFSGDLMGITNPQFLVMNAPKTVIANFSSVPVTGLRFVPLPPCRVVDTRNPVGPLGGPVLAANSTRNFVLPGSCGIPATAAAYSLNVTVMPPPGPLA